MKKKKKNNQKTKKKKMGNSSLTATEGVADTHTKNKVVLERTAGPSHCEYSGW